VSKVRDMRGMFNNATSFNHLTDMRYMFQRSSSFNQPQLLRW